jgi:hypothetical protein
MSGPVLTEKQTSRSSVERPLAAGERMGPARSPFCVGVSGFCDLTEADLARTRRTIASFFDIVRTLIPDTQFKVLLGMTGGGDLLVAEMALELDIAVEAVLPMPMDEFVADFDEAKLRLLKTLLAHQNLQCVELPQPANGTSGNVLAFPDWHATAYRNLIDVLINESNVLLALWDGRMGSRLGGAADAVVRFLGIRTDESSQALHLEFATVEPDVNTDSPFVYWIPIESAGKEARVAGLRPCFLTALGDTILTLGAELPQALRHRLEAFNEYNRDFCHAQADIRSSSGGTLLGEVPPDLALDDRPRLAQIDSEYVKADWLALYFQKRSDGLFGLFGAFAFVVGCLYLAYDKLGENQVLLSVYLVILLGSLTLYRLLYRKVWFFKHLRYRALAETMRVRFYLCFAGVGRSVGAAEVFALSGIESFEGFGWIADILKDVEPVGPAVAPVLDPRRIDFVRDAWVANQHRYFKRKVQQLERNDRQVSRWQMVAVASTVVALLARLLLPQSIRDVSVTDNVPLKNLLMLGAEIMALFLGAWKLHQSKMATRELIWQYKNQLAHFSRASEELERTATPNRKAQLLVELARRSLMESYLWTIHRYHREHAPPGGG